MRVKWFLAAALALIAGSTSYALAQDEGSGGTSEESTTTETTSVETTETTYTGDTITLKGVKIGEKKIELTIPIFETYEFEAPVGYKGVDDFFVVREANSNVRQGKFEVETKIDFWSTHKSGRGRDDDFKVTPSIKYGITDMINVELEVMPINLFDGTEINGVSGSNDGTGDLNLKLFFQVLAEKDLIPAIAVWSETRIPTGEGSEKMDQTFHVNMTKTVCKNVRWHMQHYIRSANGARGDGDRDWGWDDQWYENDRSHGDEEGIGDRRHFQWGIGTGFDYAINEKNLLVFNYMNRSSNYYGNSNSNVLGAGWVHSLNESNKIMVGVDYDDNHGDAEGARWLTKAQWSVSF